MSFTPRRFETVSCILRLAALLALVSCSARTSSTPTDGSGGSGCVGGPTTTTTGVRIPVVNNAVESVDILFEIDNSNSMAQNQQNLSDNFGVLIDTLVNPPVDPMTMRARYPPVKSMHVGVISSDLGTPGSVVPSCANNDSGDNGFLNPIRNGLAIRTHQPWMTAPPGRRPARCTMDMNQYPGFLTFDSMQINPNDPMQTYQRNFRDDFVCNAYLSTGGCGLEQQLESMYRALVIHDARATPGNMSPNAGFVRDNAVLALVMVTDEEDGSTRDTRYMEAGFPVRDAISVYDSTSPDWSSIDLNLRFYMYTPGSAQDPTWPLDRYLDPMRPTRGFTSLKPGRPDQVIFAAITGVPINLPMTASGSGEQTVDWAMLLGSMPDGSNGYTGMSPEGPISMRQRNMDPMCSTRVVPACRREGSAYNPMACDANTQYFAWPSRRIAEVARRFAATYNNGAISSICKNDYRGALAQIVERIQQRLSGRCLPRPLPYTRPPCSAMVTTNCRQPNEPAAINCIVREILPAGFDAASACTAARGRMPGSRDTSLMRDTCIVNQVPVTPGQPPFGSAQGFYYDTRPDPAAPSCAQHIEFTPNAGLVAGASAIIECVQTLASSSTTPGGACGGPTPPGGSCSPLRPDGATRCDPSSSSGCYLGTEIYLETGSRECQSGVCLAYRFAEAASNPDPARAAIERAEHVYCTCRCGLPPDLQSSVNPSSLCACPTGYTCLSNLAGAQYPNDVRGSYCVRTSTVRP